MHILPTLPGCPAPPVPRVFLPRAAGRGTLNNAGAMRVANCAIFAACLVAAALPLCRGVASSSSSASSAGVGAQKRFGSFALDLQARLCSAVEELDGSGATFCCNAWERGGSFGRTRVLQGGSVVAKGAISTSILEGTLSEERAAAMSSRGRAAATAGAPYRAATMSLVLHSATPHVPTLRADVRIFELVGADGEVSAWYGGGVDLTPYQVSEGDFREFHKFWKAVCDGHDASLYATMKAGCDDYFYIPARGEHRGIGGLFFDDLEAALPNGGDAEAFVRELGEKLIDGWRPIVQRNRAKEVTPTLQRWLEMRRARYLEFNMLYDRGVKFGLAASMDRVMVSAPPVIRWDYDDAEATEPGARGEGRAPPAVPEAERAQREALVALLSGTPKEWA